MTFKPSLTAWEVPPRPGCSGSLNQKKGMVSIIRIGMQAINMADCGSQLQTPTKSDHPRILDAQ